jgi:hypothetical protein
VLFLISYIIVVCWTLLPISMAVLVNSFVLVSAKVVLMGWLAVDLMVLSL